MSDIGTRKITTLLVDLGGVFAHANLGQVTLVGPKSTVSHQRLTTTATWKAFESGQINEEECCQQLGDQHGILPSDIAASMREQRKAVVLDPNMISTLRAIKQATLGRVKIILASNISKPDYNALVERWGSIFWSLFDQVIASFAVGACKPSRLFYRRLLQETRATPQETVFVDDQRDNILAAASLGLHTILFMGVSDLSLTLTNVFGDTIQRGMDYMRRNAGQHHSTVDDATVVKENYSQLLILDLIQDMYSCILRLHGAMFTTEIYPDDVDTTALALATMSYDSNLAHSILDDMLQNVDEEGLVQLYFDSTRPRVDAVICVNVLTLFYLNGRGYQLPNMLSWIQDILIHRAYLHGTRYYSTAEWFLYYTARLLHRSQDPGLQEVLEGPLRVRVKERIGTGGDALCIAMRICTCNLLGVINRLDTETLTRLQYEDGGWEPSALYDFPGVGKSVGNRGLTTAFAVKALQSVPE